MQGPEHYITPDWYPSKRDHGKVVPTWNYVAVHEITSIEGKWKVSQNRPEVDRKGVIAGLDLIGPPSSIEMARLIEERCGRHGAADDDN